MTTFRLIRTFLLILAAMAMPALAQDSYRVKPGDRLQIEVLEDSSLNRTAAVLPDGSFSFPYAGSLPASGRTIGQIQSELTQAIASNFAQQPNVFVSVLPAAPEPTDLAGGANDIGPTMKVYFLGEFASPGLKLVPQGASVLQALAMGGGFSKFAATKRIQLRRTARNGQQQIWEVNYWALSRGMAGRDIRLRAGDVILAPERRLFE